jgi:hypothetical protein
VDTDPSLGLRQTLRRHDEGHRRRVEGNAGWDKSLFGARPSH